MKTFSLIVLLGMLVALTGCNESQSDKNKKEIASLKEQLVDLNKEGGLFKLPDITVSVIGHKKVIIKDVRLADGGIVPVRIICGGYEKAAIVKDQIFYNHCYASALITRSLRTSDKYRGHTASMYRLYDVAKYIPGVDSTVTLTARSGATSTTSGPVGYYNFDKVYGPEIFKVMSFESNADGT